MIERPIAVMSGASRGARAQRPVGDALERVADAHAHGNRDQHAGGEDRDRRQAGMRADQRGDHRKGRHRADHHHLAVREIDELDDAVHHRVAERDHGVHAAEREAVDHLLQENVHPSSALRARPGARSVTRVVTGEAGRRRPFQTPAIVGGGVDVGNPPLQCRGLTIPLRGCVVRRAGALDWSRKAKTAPRGTPFSLLRLLEACCEALICPFPWPEPRAPSPERGPLQERGPSPEQPGPPAQPLRERQGQPRPSSSCRP